MTIVSTIKEKSNWSYVLDEAIRLLKEIDQNKKEKIMKVTTVNLPAAWASGLVNGDWSGLEFDDAEEAAKARRWQMEQNLNIVSCSEESFSDQYDGKLTDMLEYQAHVQ